MKTTKCIECERTLDVDVPEPSFDEVADLGEGVYLATYLNPPSGRDCTHLLVRADGSLGWCFADGTQSEDERGNVSTFSVDDLTSDDLTSC